MMACALRKCDVRGFTFLEVMLALLVFSVGLLGTLGLISVGIAGNASAKRLTQATQLAQDKTEELRNTPFKGLYGTCDQVFDSSNPSLCGTAPLPMAGVSAQDDGNNPCAGEGIVCGDLDANDGVWTYSAQDAPPFHRVWTVRRNYPEFRLIMTEAIVSWTDIHRRPHTVSVKTILARF